MKISTGALLTLIHTYKGKSQSLNNFNLQRLFNQLHSPHGISGTHLHDSMVDQYHCLLQVIYRTASSESITGQYVESSGKHQTSKLEVQPLLDVYYFYILLKLKKHPRTIAKQEQLYHDSTTQLCCRWKQLQELIMKCHTKTRKPRVLSSYYFCSRQN